MTPCQDQQQPYELEIAPDASPLLYYKSWATSSKYFNIVDNKNFDIRPAPDPVSTLPLLHSSLPLQPNFGPPCLN